MQRLVTIEDLLNYPFLTQRGISVNQHYDFSNIVDTKPYPLQVSQLNSDNTSHWSKYLDKIYLINLAKRPDRLKQAKEQLNHYNIPFERWEATEHEKGAEGLRLTMVQLFTHCLKNKYQNVVVFEDDVDIIQDEINEVMKNVVNGLPPYFDLIFLGGQLCNQPSEFYGVNLMKARNIYATHAVIYSNKAMKKIMAGNMTAPIDNWYCATIENENDCYITYPLLCSQIIGKSDIYSDKDFIDWKPYIEKKYWEQINNMRISGKLPSNIKKYILKYG